jgi:hypothetical protein
MAPISFEGIDKHDNYITAHPFGHAAILAIISISTFITVIILYVSTHDVSGQTSRGHLSPHFLNCCPKSVEL